MSTACTPAVLFMMIGPTEAQEARTGDRRKEMAKVITIEGHENLGEILQPERPATKESPDYCLVVAKWTHGWKPYWSLDEVYFNRGTAQAPQFDPVGNGHMDALLAIGGTDYDHTVALFGNCHNGYWSKCFEGAPSYLADIWHAAKGFFEYDRQTLYDGKSPLEFGEAQKAAEEDIPDYCEACVRIEISKLGHGDVFPAFAVVGHMHCEMHNGDNA